MSKPVDIDETLDASGGSNDSVVAAASVKNDSAVLQFEIGGATTDVDVHLEVRLASDLSWMDWIVPRNTLSNGDAEVVGIDLSDIEDMRVRIVNQDGTNTADVRAVVQTQ